MASEVLGRNAFHVKVSGMILSKRVDRDSSVGIAIRYGPDGAEIESRWGRDFPRPFKPAVGPTQPPVQWVPGLFPGDKAAGAWR